MALDIASESSWYLLDTGAANLIALEEPTALRRLMQLPIAYIPYIALGELYFGAYRYAHRHQSTKFLDIYETFRERFRGFLLPSNEDTTLIYAAIYAELTASGQPIQQNDCRIAALARQYGMVLVTVDTNFQRIPSLVVELW